MHRTRELRPSSSPKPSLREDRPAQAGASPDPSLREDRACGSGGHPGERAGREPHHRPHRRRPRRVVAELVSHLSPHEAGTDHEHLDVVCLDLPREQLAEAPNRGLARAVGARPGMRQIRRAAPP